MKDINISTEFVLFSLFCSLRNIRLNCRGFEIGFHHVLWQDILHFENGGLVEHR